MAIERAEISLSFLGPIFAALRPAGPDHLRGTGSLGLRAFNDLCH
jgi:hypothetical protein